MKKFCTFIAALAILVSCQKAPTEEEKKAEIDRQVQERLAAEHLTQEQQRLAQQKADLEAREKALADQQAAAAVPTATVTETTATVAETTPVETETAQRNSATSERSERRSSASYGTFYRKLEPYGAWRETSTYGYVWQPREAEESHNWRPYTEGRWVYTDAGWTWVSDESFGWATYHYGRWVRLRRVGWVWVPGEEWAPAWVSWRTSKDYVGWAPLPPEARFDHRHGIRNWADNYYDISPDHYTFVPGNEFGSRRIQTAVVPVERNVSIVIETTNVTNITYSNSTVVNQGPNYEEMRTRSRQPIERYRIQRQTEMNGDSAKSVVRGDVLEVQAPAIGAVPGADRPRTVRETLPQTTVEKSWSTETDHAAAERARAKMHSEATPPPDGPSRTFVRPDGASAASTPATTATVTAASATPVPVATATATAARATPSPTATTARTRTTPVPTATIATTTATPSPAATTPAASATPVPTATAAISARPSATPIPSIAASPSAVPIATPSPFIAASPSVHPRHPSLTPRPLPTGTAAPESSAAATPASSTPPAMSAPLGPRPARSPQSAAQAAEARRKIQEPPAPTPRPNVAPTVVPDLPVPAPSLSGSIPRHAPPPRPKPTAPAEGVAPPLPAFKPSPPVATPAGSPPVASSPVVPTTPRPNNAQPNDKKPRRPGRGDSEQPTPTPGASTAPN